MSTRRNISKIGEFLKKRLPEWTVFLLCVVVNCHFISMKEGYHQDELLSFEMANAYYSPWVVPTQPEGRLGKFMRTEIQGDTLSETLQNVMYVIKD